MADQSVHSLETLILFHLLTDYLTFISYKIGAPLKSHRVDRKYSNKDHPSAWCSVGLSHPLNGVLVRHDIHDRHSGYLPDSSLEILVAGGHYVASMLLDPLDYAVIGVGALVVAFEPFEARVLRDPQGDAVLDSELLEFSHHAISDVGDALAQQAVHARLEDVQLVLDAEVDEVGVQ